MVLPNEVDFKHRLLPQATSLVATATEGAGEPQIVEALLTACLMLETSASSDAPLVAIEQDVRTANGTYHLFVRRLSTSVPAGKFQILISRDLASGLIY